MITMMAENRSTCVDPCRHVCAELCWKAVPHMSVMMLVWALRCSRLLLNYIHCRVATNSSRPRMEVTDLLVNETLTRLGIILCCRYLIHVELRSIEDTCSVHLLRVDSCTSCSRCHMDLCRNICHLKRVIRCTVRPRS